MARLHIYPDDQVVPKKKPGGFYDKLGSVVGIKNPKKSALATSIDRLS